MNKIEIYFDLIDNYKFNLSNQPLDSDLYKKKTLDLKAV